MKRIYKLLSVAMLLTTIATAQTKIKDGSVTGTSSLAKPGAILDLESNKRALLLPRVKLTSTTSWDPLNGSAPTEGGYTVYNTSTTTTGGSTSYAVLNRGVGEYYWDGGGSIAKKYNAASSYQEPFQIQSTTNKAINNTDNIYQQGRISIGSTSATPASAKQLEVVGDFKSSYTDGTNFSGLETNVTGLGELSNVLQVGNNADVAAMTIGSLVQLTPTLAHIETVNGNSSGSLYLNSSATGGHVELASRTPTVNSATSIKGNSYGLATDGLFFLTTIVPMQKLQMLRLKS